MKIIDLLNKIANGEEVPKKIKLEEEIFDLIDYGKDTKIYQMIEEPYTRLDINTSCLNDEVEIIEEDKKIEKINIWYDPIKDDKLEKLDTDMSIEILNIMCTELKDKINEIIDKINGE